MKKDLIIKLSGELFEAAVIVLILYYVIFPVKITGNSMTDTLHNGDRVLISRAASYLKIKKKNDIVIMNYNNGTEDIEIVKRIAASQGDTVTVSGGRLYINEKLIEGYLCSETEDTAFVLSENQFYVLGDNAEESIDSRYFGPVDKSDIQGLVLFRIYPFDEMKILKD